MVAGNPNQAFNKKIVMTASLAKKSAANTYETRTRVFYRDDFKKDMPKIFMTNSDQENCRFEPIAGSLNPHFWNKKAFGEVDPKYTQTCETE